MSKEEKNAFVEALKDIISILIVFILLYLSFILL